MRRGKAIGVWLAAALASVALALALVPAADSRATSQPVFEAAYASFPDYLDPQLSYASEGWTAMYDTYIPLLTYRHADGLAGSEVVPGLARSLPRITDGGRTYTLFLQPGLHYSDGTRVRASDFKFTVERLFEVNSGGSPFYTDIVGARSFDRGRSAHIAGITTDDGSGKIVIHLIEPQATFSNELALLFVAPVPPSTPLRDQSFDPPPATGPYEITEADREGWSYARNPAWRHDGTLMPQIPAGHLDRIRISVIRNLQTQVDELESGKLDWLFEPPPSDRMAEIAGGRGGAQLLVEPTVETSYFWMNVRQAPFDDRKVRQAINYAVDPRVIAHLDGAEFAPTDQILPPTMPGHRPFNLYPHDMKKAHRLIREAHPSDRRITVWTDSGSSDVSISRYYRRVLQELGFEAKLKVVNQDFYYLEISSPRTPNLDTGLANWYEDYPHPNDFLGPIFASRPLYLGNYSRLVAPNLNRQVNALAREPGPIDESAYARLDRKYMKLAPIVPFGNRTLGASFSGAVDLSGFVWNPTFETDLTSLQFNP